MTFPRETLEPWRIDSLGGLRTDDDGRLIVLGGYGRSATDPASRPSSTTPNNRPADRMTPSDRPLTPLGWSSKTER